MTSSRHIFTFYTISEVLRFESCLKREKISVKLMPVPRHLSSSCGLCAVIDPADAEKVMAVCERKKLEYEEIYHE